MKVALLAKIRHGGLTEVLLEKGWTQADLARALPAGQNEVSRWMQFKDLPRSPEMRARLERATGRLFEDLFPADVQALIAADFPREMTTIREVEAHRLVGRITPLLAISMEEDVLRKETHTLLYEALADLSPKEQQILRLRFGLGNEYPHTLQECGTILRCSGSRVREIEAQALAKIGHRKHTASMDKLRSVRSRRKSHER